jgi:hypothetical protein
MGRFGAAIGIAVGAAWMLMDVHAGAAAQTCEFHVSPVRIDVSPSGQSGAIAIETHPDCTWTATLVFSEDARDWIETTSTGGSGSGSIGYTANALGGSPMRQARIKVRWNTPTLGQDVVLTQQHGPCTARFSPFNEPTSSLTFGALAGAGQVSVVTAAGSPSWYLTTADDWIALSPPAGIFGFGDRRSTFFVAENPSAQPRTGTIVGCDGSRLTIRQAGRTAATGRYVPGDFDGDGRADLVIFRPSHQLGVPDDFFVLHSGSNYDPAGAIRVASGAIGQAPMIGDFDGDGRADAAGFTGFSTWSIAYSSDDYRAGTATVTTLPTDEFPAVRFSADFDGSGKSALTAFLLPSGVWHSTPLTGAVRSLPRLQWGRRGDLPIAADFDGDRVADVAVWRPEDGRWYILPSSEGYAAARATAIQWGTSGDLPVTGDVDGDGRIDLIVWRPTTGTWYVLPSSRGFDPRAGLGFQWGAQGDFPIAADYDGDGRIDFAVWRPSNGTWYLLFSSTGYSTASARSIQWGRSISPLSSDRPVAPTAAPLPLTISTPGCTTVDARPGDRISCFILVYPGANPASRPFALADFRAIGGPAAAHISECVACGPPPHVFELSFTIPSSTPPGLISIPITALDENGRQAPTTIFVRIRPR